MYSLIFIGKEKSFLRSILQESIEDPCQVGVFPSLLDLYPHILSEEPLVMLIDCNNLSENELGVISVLKRTYPYLRILLSVSMENRTLAAKSISHGADAYILEPYFMDEMAQFVRQAYQSALNDIRQSLEMRMKALSLFIQGLAPEINNCLTPILGTLQLLTAKVGAAMKEEEKKEHYDCMYTESMRIKRTVDELENFAKPRRPKKNAVSLKETIEGAIQEAEKDSLNEVPIENDFHGDIDTILIDRGHIQSALVAVLRFLKENADEEEGRVVLSTHTPHPHSLYITVQGFETVSLGEDIHHAFIPLYTRKIARFGQELGLASAYGLLQSHGGSIRVEATRKGSKFHISLPLEEGPVP